MKYWVRVNKQSFGPVSPEQIRKITGVTEDSFVCPEGATSAPDWRRLRDVPALAQALTGPAAPTSAAPIGASDAQAGLAPIKGLDTGGKTMGRYLGMALAALTAVGGSSAIVRLWSKSASLQTRAATLQSENEALKAEVAKLSETDQTYWNRGVDALNAEKYQDAIGILQELIEKYPGSKLSTMARAMIPVAEKKIAEVDQRRAQEETEKRRVQQEAAKHQAEMDAEKRMSPQQRAIGLLIKSRDHGIYWAQMWAPCFVKAFPGDFRSESKPVVGGGTTISYVPMDIHTGTSCVFAVQSQGGDVYGVVGALGGGCVDKWKVDLGNGAIEVEPDSCSVETIGSRCTTQFMDEPDCPQKLVQAFRSN
jgi:hypothetical protein